MHSFRVNGQNVEIELRALVIPPNDRERVLLRVLPGSQEDRKSQTHPRPLSFEHMPHPQTILLLLELVQWGDLFTTINLKDAYICDELAPKRRMFQRFAFQGVAFEYNKLPIGYLLALRTFSKCVK